MYRHGTDVHMVTWLNSNLIIMSPTVTSFGLKYSSTKFN